MGVIDDFFHCFFRPKNIYCYNVITYGMGETVRATIRKIGNSYGVIIPSKIIKKLQIYKGEKITITIPSSNRKKRNERIKKLAGSEYGKESFTREKKDRF